MQKARNKELEARVEALLNERDVLKGRVQQLKVGSTLPVHVALPFCMSIGLLGKVYYHNCPQPAGPQNDQPSGKELIHI